MYRLFFLLFLISAIQTKAQTCNDSVTAIASTLFKINGGRTLMMGANYRKEWKTPIRVPVLNLTTESGGLKPVKRGGGKQTRSLRMVAPNGKEYNLRSVQKFITSKTLPADLQSEAAEDLVADGVSASYPYSTLSIPVLAQAAGVPYLKVKLVMIPNDPRLGEFQKDFGNLLAYLEERLPDDARKAYDTDEVAEKLKDDNDNSVDQHALMNARILDMFVMDLDRHEGQWLWVAKDKSKGKEFYPIPKDRDQAFYTNQGLLPGIIALPSLAPQLEGFKAKAKNIKRFNFAARNLDRFFLNELTEKDWTEATNTFLSRMTDDVIEKALAQQPPEIKNLSVNKLVNTLKKRRNYLAAETLEYYKFLSEYVDITTSDKTELFDITRNDDGSVLVQIYKINKEGERSNKIYERNFDPGYTKEIRLYGFGGDDKFMIKGNNDKIKIRMIGGDGEDSFENTGPSKSGNIVYDMKSGNNKLTGNLKNRQSHDTIVNSYQRLYYKYNQVTPFISIGYNPDDGLYLGASLKIIQHGFRKTPYKSSHAIAVNHALSTKAFNFRYNAEFIGVFGRSSDLLFETDIRSPHITNFFGYGASAVYDKTKPGKFKYYRARYTLGDISLELRKRFSDKVTISIGPVFEFYTLDANDKNNKNRYIVQTTLNGLNPATLYSNQSYLGGKFSLTADTRDNKVLPSKGIIWQTSLTHLSGLNTASYDVTQLNSEFTFHFNLLNRHLVVANRSGGGHNFGDFEFYQAQYLGSEDHLRGYRKNRFAGRSKLFNNTDVRIRLANFHNYLFPGSLGILGFYDVGKIWADNDTSEKWLSGYGGGFWISPLRRVVFTFTYAISKEDKLPLIGLGWKF
jgi:hypothetical protein